MKIMLFFISLFLLFNVSARVITLTPENHIILEDAFNGATTSTIMNEVLEKINENSDLKELYLLLDTPGGNIFDGIQMIDFLKSQKVKIHTISFFAASMGFQTVQGLGTRYLLENGILMSHKASGGFRGTFPNGSLDATYNFWTKLVTTLDENTAKRTNGKHTLKSYQDLISHDYWCKGQTCLDQGFVDEIIQIRCSDELSGTKDVIKRINFLGMSQAIKVTKSKCPAIRAPLEVKVMQNNKFININEGTFSQDFIDIINREFINKVTAQWKK